MQDDQTLSGPRRAGRVLTFTEEARRRQIVDCTVELVAERGPGAASLSAIAARAGISKAAVGAVLLAVRSAS